MTRRNSDQAAGSPAEASKGAQRGHQSRYAPSTRAADLKLLAAGGFTGWWDDEGRPAPWPEDFFLADGTINPDWQPGGDDGPAEPCEPGAVPF